MKKIIKTALIALTMTVALPAASQASSINAYINNYVHKKCHGDGSAPARRGMNIPGANSAHREISCATAAKMDAVSNVYTEVYERFMRMPEIHERNSDGSLTSSALLLRHYARENACAAPASEYTVLTQVIHYSSAADITRRYTDC